MALLGFVTTLLLTPVGFAELGFGRYDCLTILYLKIKTNLPGSFYSIVERYIRKEAHGNYGNSLLPSNTFLNCFLDNIILQESATAFLIFRIIQMSFEKN